ncbi:TonB-dependent siderophore receptor [Achromobacter xylosoxidans]|uniref:TonB-dependent siderophore receptor n=1 Tax=Alcaligenes xylosoxydans xylosoxydans TaxID=85698 RepID=UPI003D037ED1
MSIRTLRPRHFTEPARRPDAARRAPLARSLAQLACAGALVAMAGGLPVAAAQEAGAVTDGAARRYDIPAGPLDAVLARYAAESGVLLASPPGLVQGRHSPGVQGTYDSQAALMAALSGTGVEAVRDAQGQYRLRAATSAEVTTLAPVTVPGLGIATTEGTGSYASNVVTIAKGDQSLREIPQAVSVITRQRMDDQNITDIRDALNHAPGVSMVANEPGGQFYSRGFFIQSYQFDGVPLERQLYARGSAFNSDAALYDRVEIMRGPQGLFEGAGDPSGSVNMVRKRPTPQRQFVFTGKAGSWDQYGAQVDLGGALNDSKSVRGRVVVNYDSAGSFRDYIDSHDRTFYGALDIDLGAATTVGIGYSREKPYGVIDWSGLPNYADGSMPDYARSTNLSAPWNHASKTQDTWFADLTHRFANGWKFKAALVRVQEANDIKYLLRTGRLGPPNTYRGDAYAFDMESRNLGGDTYLTGDTTLFGRKLGLTVGANFSHLRSNDTWGWLRNVETLNRSPYQRFTAPALNSDEIIAANRMDDGYRSDKKGLYASARYQLADPLLLVLGGRYSWYKQTYISNGVWGYSETTAEESAEFTPFVGAVVTLDDQWSAYANYADIFRPQSQRGVSGEFLAPVTGRNYELGLKGELLDGRVDVGLALFRTEQKNVAFEDTDIPQAVANAQCGGTCYRPTAQVRSQGFEAEINGEVLPGLQLSASYTYTQTRHRSADVPAVGYDISANTGIPRHLARLWANYRLPGEWSRYSVGAGLTTQSKSSGFGYYGREQGGYTVLDARLGYRVDERLSFALNLGNLTDKKYYSSISYDHNYYGAPRNYLLTVQYRM